MEHRLQFSPLLVMIEFKILSPKCPFAISSTWLHCKGTYIQSEDLLTYKDLKQIKEHPSEISYCQFFNWLLLILNWLLSIKKLTTNKGASFYLNQTTSFITIQTTTFYTIKVFLYLLCLKKVYLSWEKGILSFRLFFFSFFYKTFHLILIQYSTK